jgi:hypothetical protein
MHVDIVFGTEVAIGDVHYALLFSDRYSKMNFFYPLHNLTSDIPKQLQAANKQQSPQQKIIKPAEASWSLQQATRKKITYRRKSQRRKQRILKGLKNNKPSLSTKHFSILNSIVSSTTAS